MAPRGDPEAGNGARLAVRAAANRLALLLRTVRRPAAPAVGTWDLTDVAIHVSHSLEAVTALARGGGPLLDDLEELSALTSRLVVGEGTRDLAVLADRIEASAATFLEVVASGDASPRPWLVRGIELPPSALVGQVLNELVVHGWDVARAEGVSWPVPGRHAALVLDTFLLPVLGHLGPALVDPQAARGVHAAFDLRVRGGGRAVLRVDDGDLVVEHLERAARVVVDCHLSVEPAAFLLVAWGRRSQWPAIARGRFLAWGRRPWLAPRLRPLLRNV
ncbi:MAG: hypothetical protein M3P97_03960 [Actinomycetota bacterium]|jgi:hypothetical protein|nr:hypothetical protein [Actinomycetota bacterium]